PTAARHDVEAKLDRVLPRVLGEVLKPLQARLRGSLGRQHDGTALRFVGGQRRVDVRLLVQAGGQRERVLHGQLGAGADREVRGLRGVAEQDDVVVAPGRVADGREADPLGVVGEKGGFAQYTGEKLRRNGLLFIEARPAPDVFVHLDDERARVSVEWIAVDL